MKITLSKATKDDKNTIQNLGRFYVYEMSRYCGFLPSWEVPQNGLFECIDLSSYCEKLDRYAFLVKVDDELAGFVLINKVGSTPDVDWNIGEFFIVSKFQGKGVGRYVAENIFNQFPGVWETSQIPENTAAIAFWDNVVSQYSHGRFEKTLKSVLEPKPHPMIILKFTSFREFTPSYSPHPNPMRRLDVQELERNSYHLEYYDTILHGEVLLHGISEEAFRAKELLPILPFSIFIKDNKQNVLGGISGATFYGSLYVDSLWIVPFLRKKGWGTRLMQEAEKIGKERNSRFVTVNTMDWEAVPFYKKLGYSIKFTREGYDKNSKMFLLRKSL
jgi:predicted acetyltransferase